MTGSRVLRLPAALERASRVVGDVRVEESAPTARDFIREMEGKALVG